MKKKEGNWHFQSLNSQIRITMREKKTWSRGIITKYIRLLFELRVKKSFE